jgi:hypothetical protein
MTRNVTEADVTLNMLDATYMYNTLQYITQQTTNGDN